MLLKVFPKVRRLRSENKRLRCLDSENATLRHRIDHLAAVEASTERWMRHHRRSAIEASVGVSTGDAANDRELVNRVVSAYRKSIEGEGAAGESMWCNFFEQYHKDIHEAFLAGDLDEATAILRNPTSNDLMYGFDDMSRAAVIGRDAGLQRIGAEWVKDHLIRLAEAVGVFRLDNPETYDYAPATAHPTEAVLDALDAVYGAAIVFPNPYPGEVGLATGRGVASFRAVHALYQAWRIRELVGDAASARVLEIGAGLGRNALYARALGISDYTIIDLPMTRAAQGYFLGRTLGADGVLLAGETAPDPAMRVKILPPSQFHGQPATYDLVVNVDSLTEMDRDVARAYVRRIQQVTTRFLSINHEVNAFTVRELLAGDPAVATYSRHPAWLRRGYVEELFTFHRQG
jgi:hypothetical protein